MSAFQGQGSQTKTDFLKILAEYTRQHRPPKFTIVFQWLDENGHTVEVATFDDLQPPLCSIRQGSGHGRCWHVFTFMETVFQNFWAENTQLEGSRRERLLEKLGHNW